MSDGKGRRIYAVALIVGHHTTNWIAFLNILGLYLGMEVTKQQIFIVTCYVPGTFVDMEDAANKTDNIPTL